MLPPEQEPDDQGIWEIGGVLSDRYRVEEKQRRSSTGHLYRVVDIFRQTPHLVLGPSERTLKDRAGVEWFVRFCRNALSVPNHPNLLASRRMDYEGTVPYLVMDYVEGSYWDRAIKQGELVELSPMLDLAIQVARGLEWLHENGRLHGNVKPANVIIGAESGLAQVIKYGETDAHTRAYAAPEQLSADRPITPATDLWCWGTSVLHMFTGMVNWSLGSKAPQVLARYLHNGPAVPGLALMPVPLVQLLQECFAHDSDERPSSTAEVTSRLEEIYYDVTNSAYQGPPGEGGYNSEHLVDQDVAEYKRRTAHEREPAPPPRRFSPRRRAGRRHPSPRERRSPDTPAPPDEPDSQR